MVVFDRFFVEEMFGWQVHRVTPRCLRILDTQDLHFLRAERQQASTKSAAETPRPAISMSVDVRGDLASRELASVQRSDCTLIISPAEMRLLTHDLAFPAQKLFYLPICSRLSTLRPFDPAASHQAKQGLCTIGNFQHAPNVDALHWLKEEIWPLLRARLPNAEFHVYGSHSKPSHERHFHDPSTGWHFKGFVDDHLAALAQHLVLVAPLRFGAGQKGKIVDALSVNTPVVTTSVGAEGMAGGGGSSSWGGLVADTPRDLASAVVQLVEDPSVWNRAVLAGRELIRENHDFDAHQARLGTHLKILLETLEARRGSDWMAATLFHSGNRATEFLSKYIKAKEELQHLKKA